MIEKVIIISFIFKVIKYIYKSECIKVNKN